MEAVALFSFTASEAAELSFQKGGIIKSNSACVLIGYNFPAHVSSGRWFAGRVSRHEAEQRLRWQDTGVFLVRESESAPGEFSLSVSYGDRVEHFRVLEGGGQYCIWDKSFRSLNRLVDFYRTHSIAVEQVVCLKDKPRLAQALCDYTPPHTAHLHFLRGDIIDVLDCSSSLTWRGRCRGRVGIFPPEYVQPLYH
uniref:GRB2-related adapter protein-like n=1 Tax=Mastacembelus armatus TaxID=205130 RepID=A0A7N8XEP6_9TELE